MRLFRHPSVPPRSPGALAQGDASASEGEYQDVTVLFADLEGFTTMTEQLPAREVVGLLNAYFTVMTDVTDRFEGRVDKLIGDAMLVVWSGSTPPEAARRAVQAALALQEAIAALQERLIAEGRRPPKVRIGISSGRAVVGAIGAPQRRETTVIGDAVNTAARLEALNKEFHTDSLLSGATQALVAEAARVRDLGWVTLKGRREPIRAFELLGWKECGA